ncbi:hypothetical protein [Pontibacillus litoralis]|uniref:Uncharacterized protein n=1 Tax=Pontibacillus litoralis JSM 072002 TaxID=1385512 RepID=A0A0A5HUD0_9BACI|nr:hypothetical protein [Pontibacillus litoralis]KGX87252.1 hypothetical protein N784_16455 [Pontibacillus litoralis JSM 072002]
MNNLQWLTSMFALGRRSALFGRRRRFSLMRGRRRSNSGGLVLTLLGVAGVLYGTMRNKERMGDNAANGFLNFDRFTTSTKPETLEKAQYAFSEEFHPEQ